VEKLFIVPLKVPLALNDAGKLMELDSFFGKVIDVLAVDTSSFISKSKYWYPVNR
jgi:hypothetical protein